MTAQQVIEIITNSAEISKESPEPLRKLLQQATEFPIDALPQLLKDTILALHDKVQAPIGLCAQSVLAAVNLAVQGHVNIMMQFGEAKAISCFFLTIAESGERKTSCDNAVLKPVKEYEQVLREQHKQDLFKWQNSNDAWHKQRERIYRDKKSYPDRNSLQKALELLGEAPEPPLTPLLTCSEPTFEGLCKLMITSAPSLGVFSSEGGQFIGGYAMSADNKLRTAAALSGVWDGEAIKRVRGGDGTLILAGRRLSMHLMVQPDIGRNFLSDDTLKDQGLFSRLLISYPSSTIGTRFQRELKLESIKALDKFNEKIANILKLPLPIKDGSSNELNPGIITMTDEALNEYTSFSNNTEKELAAGKSFESIKGFANKLPEHACRIAATLAAIDNIEVKKLDYRYMKMGIEIASYYGQEALRLSDNGAIDPDIILAEKLLDWLHNKWKEEYISLPDICQRGPYALSLKAAASKIVAILEDHGWLKKQKEPMLIKGEMRRVVFKIIRLKSQRI